MDLAVSAGALAAAFAAVGLLATALFRLDSKMDAGFTRLESKMDAGFARLDAKLDAGFARQDTRFDRVDDRLSAVEIQLARHLERHG